MEGVKEGQKVLVISNVLHEDDIQNALKVKDLNITHVTPQQFADEKGSNPSTFDIVLPHSIEQSNLLNNLLSKILKSLKPGGTFIVTGSVKDYDNIELELKINGFVNVKVEGDRILAAKPNYEIGSATKLKLNSNPVKSVWKIDADDEEVETIDPDNLLDEDDLKKPDPSALRVCGTTGKRKACKDCSCGLADELEAETKGKVIDTTDFPKSSCGSCYLGDAFRCSTCPYLGMPAFKPGEKIQLSENFLKSDL